MWNDLRYALRGLGRNPTLAVVAILTLALGIGVNTTIFSVAEAYFLRPLPGKNPAHLVRLISSTPREKTIISRFLTIETLASSVPPSPEFSRTRGTQGFCEWKGIHG